MGTYEHALNICRAFGVTDAMVMEHRDRIVAMSDLNEVNKFLHDLGKDPESVGKFSEENKAIVPTDNWRAKVFADLEKQSEQKSRDDFYTLVSNERAELEELRRKYSRKVNEMTEHRSRYAAKFRTYKEMETIYNKGETLTYNPAELVRKACSDGFYHFFGVRDNRLVFTTDEIVMEYEGQRLSFGHFLIKIAMEGSDHKIYPLMNNLNANGYFHPHISEGRYLCMGEAEGAILEAAKNRDYAETLSLIRAILLNYNESSPYVSFDAFSEADNEKGRGDDADSMELLKRLAESNGFEWEGHRVIYSWQNAHYSTDGEDEEEEYEEEYEEEEEDDIDW